MSIPSHERCALCRFASAPEERLVKRPNGFFGYRKPIKWIAVRCRRYPTSIFKAPEAWCGEFKR